MNYQATWKGGIVPSIAFYSHASSFVWVCLKIRYRQNQSIVIVPHETCHLLGGSKTFWAPKTMPVQKDPLNPSNFTMKTNQLSSTHQKYCAVFPFLEPRSGDAGPSYPSSGIPWFFMGVSIHGGIQKWMACKGKSDENMDDDLGVPLF